jgi:tRNA-specific 2-thiouridylase
MNLPSGKVRALGLCSGGLDSILSALVLKRQGIEVEWITFETPFFSSTKARQAAESTGIPITVQDITTVYIEMLKNPPCGYGKHMNPCMDCHALMFRLAGIIMKEKGFDFLFSGEVVGQRPMSQTKPSLRYVEKASGFDGLIVRPLSAQRLPVTIPEQEGLVNREMLLDFSGRSRKPQIELAEEFGISDHPSPAGGCLLTDKGYSDRLRDLFDHQEGYSVRDLYLLKHGRHLRLDKITKIIVGRTKQDNDDINKYFNPARDALIKVSHFPGPIVLLPNGGGKDSLARAASICVGYSKAPDNREIDVTTITPQGQEIIKVIGTPPKENRHLLI